jgi:hypothetical protein
VCEEFWSLTQGVVERAARLRAESVLCWWKGRVGGGDFRICVSLLGQYPPLQSTATKPHRDIYGQPVRHLYHLPELFSTSRRSTAVANYERSRIEGLLAL